ncbi:unnamed protein product [Oppiella nova]|uniref:Mpv17-like protein 2 n=1 Tax=Oppiella nova TaxID=334625 RepID=A0A7R9LCZ1_9ACAR|nr:unnamed protein product [Oppiella nova]CAG2162369.1 unnamed protein product [Oppiella nova]
MFSNAVKSLFKRLYSPKYLVITNSMTGVVSVVIGDTIQQFLEYKFHKKWSQSSEQKEFQFNGRRNLNMSFAGIYFGIFGHFWYGFLDRRFPGSQRRAVLKKLAAEMAMGPPLVSGLFLIVSKLKAMSFENSWNDLKTNFVLICTQFVHQVEWLVYIPLQYLNFRYLPKQFRYLYVAIISLAYDAFLSYVIHKNDRLRRLKDAKEEEL